jgi:hypothetical protein
MRPKLKALFFFYLNFIVFTFSSCKKSNDAKDNNPTLADTTVHGKLQGKWQLISVTHYERNGPGRFQYRGAPSDYMKFTKDSIYTFVQGINDNVKYKLLPDDSTFVFSKYNAQPKQSDTLHITTLTANLLVFYGYTNTGDLGIDSLKR